jgi:hypothetical protein
MGKKIQYNFLCDKKWNALSGNEQQRFCKECSIHVHNLNESIPEEKSFCGRLLLDAKEGNAKKEGLMSIRVLAAAAVAAGLISLGPVAQAQEKDSITTGDEYVIDVQQEYYIIKGLLTEHESARPIFGEIYYFDTWGEQHSWSSNADGIFRMEIPKSHVGVAIDLHFRSFGYRDMEVVGIRLEEDSMLINAHMTLLDERIELIGDVVIVEDNSDFRKNFDKDFSGRIWGREEIRRYPGR